MVVGGRWVFWAKDWAMRQIRSLAALLAFGVGLGGGDLPPAQGQELGTAQQRAKTLTPDPQQSQSVAITLHDGAGAALEVGRIRFEREGDGYAYTIQWDEAQFGEYFLSMRPFKCLEGAQKLWCRVPYPYEIRRIISEGDLTDLAYDTLFVWKRANDYGIDMWNGIYYRFELSGGALVGRMHEMDMGLLAVPPVSGDLRPVGPQDIEPAEPGSHWLPTLTIEAPDFLPR